MAAILAPLERRNWDVRHGFNMWNCIHRPPDRDRGIARGHSNTVCGVAVICRDSTTQTAWRTGLARGSYRTECCNLTTLAGRRA